ncbi:MAG: hypothetical protein NW215_02230 [Hyphomicrobiales bacterium]|nr:hypothetical protein [Hyphomicrobiales bacterium]
MSKPSQGIRRYVFPYCVIGRQSPFLMFTLGVLSALIAARLWDSEDQRLRPDRVIGVRDSQSFPPPVPDNAALAPSRTFASAETETLVLDGVNGELLADAARANAPARMAGAARVSIRSAHKLKVGEVLKLVAASGAEFSFRVADASPMCIAADPAREPVPDVALVVCDGERGAAQWRYVIEAVAEPPPNAAHPKPRSL